MKDITSVIPLPISVCPCSHSYFNLVLILCCDYCSLQLSIFGMFLLHTLWYLLPPSARYPDLKVMLFVIYSAAHFVCFWIAFNVKQWSEGEKEVEDWNLEKVKLGDMKEKNKKKR